MHWVGKLVNAFGTHTGYFVHGKGERGHMIEWEDGIEETPGGMGREIVQPSMWSSSVWITPVGEGFRRYWNPVTQRWGKWERLDPSLDQERERNGQYVGGERVGYTLANGWMSNEQAIATAWLHRAPDSRAQVMVMDRASPDASNLAWGEPEDDPEAGEFAGERWSALRWCIGLVPCDGQYQISSHGRLRNPHGRITRGFAALGSRWAACKGSGLVNLLMAAGLVRMEKVLPKRLYHAYCSISAGVPVTDHAKRHRLTLNTAWAYYNSAAPMVEKLCHYGKVQVSEDLWKVLKSMETEPLLGGKLSDLHPEVTRRLGREIPMEELRFARTCLV